MLVPSIRDVSRQFEEWYDIWPNGVYRLRPKPVISIGPRAESLIQFSEYSERELRGGQWEVIDARQVTQLAGTDQPGYLGFLQARAQQLLDGPLEHVMPLEIAWHLALVNGLQCDWGGCNKDATAARYTRDLRQWLPVCFEHQLGPVSVVSHSAAAAE